MECQARRWCTLQWLWSRRTHLRRDVDCVRTHPSGCRLCTPAVASAHSPDWKHSHRYLVSAIDVAPSEQFLNPDMLHASTPGRGSLLHCIFFQYCSVAFFMMLLWDIIITLGCIGSSSISSSSIAASSITASSITSLSIALSFTNSGSQYPLHAGGNLRVLPNSSTASSALGQRPIPVLDQRRLEVPVDMIACKMS
ncbi:hypothetical protein BKA62DRAFT_119220 [Auriculariales sp. MPI-PUGE-AT-0066]|nr:hypothetical protein BKA62DRAFT_119220 [Auriculariales sp. MPI-PUGE-AT-0066]